MKVWILTSEYNDYDQHGEYFEAVFAQKPTLQQIQKHCDLKKLGLHMFCRVAVERSLSANDIT